MAVTFVATPQSTNLPPRVRLDLDTGSSSSIMTDATVTRDGVAVRSQPPVGSRVSVAFDYEAPFGTACTYTAVIVATTTTTVRTETWSTLTGWSTVTGSPAVAGGALTAGKVTRTIGGAFPSSGRLTISAAAHTSGSLQFGPLRFNVVTVSGGGQVVYVEHLNASDVPITTSVLLPYTAASDVIVTWGAGTVSLVTSTGSADFAGTPAAASFVLVASSVLSGFLLESSAGSATTTLTQTITLDVDAAWLIHPATPTLSTCIDTGAQRTDGLYVVNISAATVSRGAKGTTYSPIGRPRDVFISEGDRGAGDWSLVIAAPQVALRDNLVAELRDQTPLLLRVPPSFDWDLPDDFYSVGDYSDDRVLDHGATIRRVLTLPLSPADSPIVSQAAVWSWGDVLSNYATWADVLDAFPTWLDVLVGPQ